jgi:hypothetical protein
MPLPRSSDRARLHHGTRTQSHRVPRPMVPPVDLTRQLERDESITLFPLRLLPPHPSLQQRDKHSPSSFVPFVSMSSSPGRPSARDFSSLSAVCCESKRTEAVRRDEGRRRSGAAAVGVVGRVRWTGRVDVARDGSLGVAGRSTRGTGKPTFEVIFFRVNTWSLLFQGERRAAYSRQ